MSKYQDKYTYPVTWSDEEMEFVGLCIEFPFMIRIPPKLHRRLAIEAAEEGASLNRWASKKLAHSE